MAKKLDIAQSVTPLDAVHVSKATKELAKEKIKELIAEETRMVRGIFMCYETPGASIPISVRKYPGIEAFKKTMTDGHTYEIPLYVARFLNGVDVSAGALAEKNTANQMIGTCSYAVHGFKWEAGQSAPSGMPGQVEGNSTLVPTVAITKRVKRFGFQSLEFGGAVE